MYRKKLFLICACCSALIVLLIAAAMLFAPDERPLKDPISCYQEIAELALANADHAYSVTVETNRQVNGQSFHSHAELTVLRRYQDGLPIILAFDKAVTMGAFQYNSFQWLETGTLYLELNGNRFSGTAVAEDICPPLLLLSGTEYAQADGTEGKTGISIEFRDVESLEHWALPQGAEFQSAYGSLTASKDRILQECSYSITYKQGDQLITQTYTSTPLPLNSVDFSEPDKSAYQKLSAIEAPLLLEEMSGYLLQATQIASDYSEYIYCQTFGDQRTRDMSLTMSQADPFSATLTTTAALVNSSRSEEVSAVQQEERFQNGMYSKTGGTEPAVQDNSITQEQFQTHCQDILVGTVLLPQFIRDVTIQEDENHLTLTVTPTEDLAGLLCEEAGQSLYQEPGVLSANASSTVTELLSAYLTIDKATGLPAASGIHYKGIYTITELPYRLEYTTDQNYRFA